MNNQELIEKYEKLEGVCKDPGAEIARLIFLEDLRELDEPQKVTVPQFVADWIERSKQEKRNLRNALNNGGEKMRLWFLDLENYDTFARAWLDGYTVEKEKRYRVSLKNGQPLLKAYLGKALYFSQDIAIERDEVTRKELEQAGFEWVFDCPGIEIEEVEDDSKV